MQLRNGFCETILSPDDFEDVIDKYLGYEAAQYFHEMFADYDEAIEVKDDYEDKCCRVEELEQVTSNLEDKIADLEDKIEDLESEIENRLDEYRSLEEDFEEYRYEHR